MGGVSTGTRYHGGPPLALTAANPAWQSLGQAPSNVDGQFLPCIPATLRSVTSLPQRAAISTQPNHGRHFALTPDPSSLATHASAIRPLLTARYPSCIVARTISSDCAAPMLLVLQHSVEHLELNSAPAIAAPLALSLATSTTSPSMIYNITPLLASGLPPVYSGNGPT